jgi:hypothetical protein
LQSEVKKFPRKQNIEKFKVENVDDNERINSGSLSLDSTKQEQKQQRKEKRAKKSKDYKTPWG